LRDLWFIVEAEFEEVDCGLTGLDEERLLLLNIKLRRVVEEFLRYDL
jgi:hypothetical protein